uniref:Imidazole glycerol phosphate synthase hisHF n=1 Tax=Chromera velia CCMP2878 TaxID=1169474 RepID=A0A0G4GMX5_9ALVE|mmetsp:Transcript_1674/g.3441  ORF Transcript_1674/g.3441 Transcript_1674/m.3441 type:complete len:564 (-) Transcript_1674:167-1858(-)|eukprot:Cvel_4933.t1-p1 / transcript=Cvel_4933.t1 / gene=Cvel_4933 / organism=Chromera_velia_CCMP2878 / gene_product=Imidazole glycerol phosphate synthase hisHF, putative / transcript_product=Imidazole glycerol phosphate synthase hisHF, putative / location=Cvel_scaffold223:17582-23274(-) / protein_length=563 / sequence_SO=supercontig / SO=protein_coding / is_pseudo=false
MQNGTDTQEKNGTHSGGVFVLDYGAGNVRSVYNALRLAGCEFKVVASAEDIHCASRLIFPGVGAFGQAMNALKSKGYFEALRAYLHSGKPFFGICIGLQVLCLGSEESEGTEGLGIIPEKIRKFPENPTSPCPHIGWNRVKTLPESHSQAAGALLDPQQRLYFVHSYHLPLTEASREWTACLTDYGETRNFVSAVQRGAVFATQFHPEKSGGAGVEILRRFLTWAPSPQIPKGGPLPESVLSSSTELSRRVIACLDVRTNDTGDLVVTKGDQYDVREKGEGGEVRNLGKPVDLARRYFEEGADEVTFLNITSFANSPLEDVPMLEVLRRASETVFVPLTVGGGIRDLKDPDGTLRPALEVAGLYFRSGADKVSIGSDAVYAAKAFWERGGKGDGTSSIEQIAEAYGKQAVVVSVDPKRVYVKGPGETTNQTIETCLPGLDGESVCWYACTVKGGRETTDLGVVELVTAVEALGAGEILLNCIDRDGTNSGFDLELIRLVKSKVGIPVIASSGAGSAAHFVEVFRETTADAALAAGIFHRREVPISSVKQTLQTAEMPVRILSS